MRTLTSTRAVILSRFPQSSHMVAASSCILHHSCLQALGVLDIDCLHVTVELLLCALFVVTLARDANAEPERNALDAGLPDLLIQLRV